MGLSFCLTVSDGCSVLWVTESSCVVDCVCVCCCEYVQECVCVCCVVLLRRSWVRVDLFRVILTAMFRFHHAALSRLVQIAEDIVCAVES